MERLGIVDELRERREVPVSRLSPSARHQALPTLYARPMPCRATAIEDVAPLHAKIAELKAELAREREEVARLNLIILAMRVPTPRFSLPKAVMSKFCEAMTAAGILVEGRVWDVRDLTSPLKSKQYAQPRHVCVWLVRQVCRSISTTQLGDLFVRERTSMMHALERAPEFLCEDPVLRAVAAAVLAAFGAPMPEVDSLKAGAAS